ncbi:DUF11 domain-containing protein [Deinococcus sp. NW-56]|uniref:DUF11 domain-containing protein n=1 Tax=Deinococcus sp. NW-56 TaxID=2080419 RepID=UPI001319CC21|nr:DUF11 domain-containing protein [Deinococcus sp. NW-56]
MKRFIRKFLPTLALLGTGGAGAQSVSLAQRVTETGTINYVTTGASFRANNANSSTNGASCLLTSSTAASVTGFRVANGAVSPARTAAQTVPTGATVTKAYLYWTAAAGETGFNNGGALVDNAVKFYVNGTTAPTTNNVTASRTWTGSLTGNNVTIYGMGAFADVTSIVRSSPNAQFRMDDLTVFNASGSRTCNTSTMYGNWGLYIVYSLPTESNKTLAFFDGLQYVGGTGTYPTSATNTSVTLSGLRVPNAAPGTEKIAKTTLLVSDGDASTGASNDSLSLSTNLDAAFAVSNSLNPANDIFNGSLTEGPTDGSAATGFTATDSPGVVGGLDFDTFDLSSRVSSGTTSLTATVDSASGELLMLYNAVLMATTTTADLGVTKTAPATQQGAGTLTYTITASNAGPDEAYNVVVSDPLPAGVTFVSASGGGSYDAATRRVTWNTRKFLANTSQTYTVTVTVPNTAATYQNTVSVSSGSFDPNAANDSAAASTTVTVAPPPASNPTAYPPTCDVIDWSTSGVSSGSNQTSLSNATRTFNSRGSRSIDVRLTSASGTGNGIMGYSSSFTNYGSWYEVRAVSESIQPNIGQSFLTRAGGTGNSNNIIVITFPTPVVNVRLGLTDLDAVGGVAGSGDWAGVQAGYGGQTFNPDVLVGGGHALAVQAYTGAPSGAGAAMTVTVPGLGNSQMKAASASSAYNTLMGVDAAYGTQVTPQGGGTAVNRQGQGVAYFKGPLTSLTITTGSLKGGAGQGIAFSNIDFCPPSVAVDKAAGSPVRQADYSYDIPYILTYRNTSPNVGYHPDATVRDATFSPSIPTPTGADPWARQRPQLTDAVLDQIQANTNVAAATLRGTPTLSGATNTVNLDATDLAPAFTGTAANRDLLLANTDGRVDPGGRFDVGFTANVKLKNTATTAQTVNNQATATASLYTGSLTATSNTVASSLTPGAALSVSKVADQALIRYPLTSGAGRVRYTITVTNTSGLTATGVQLTDTLPASLPYAASESGNTPPTTRNGQTLTWNLGTLAPNASSSVVVFVDVPTASSLEAAAGQAQTTIVNTASVQATNAPAASGSVAVNTLYTRLFKQVRNLGPQGTLTPAWASTANGLPGDVLEYCIDVTNLGSVALANYQISDVVPANTRLVAGTASLRQGGMNAPGASVTGVTVTSAPTGNTERLQTSALTLAPGAQTTLCFRAIIR